MRKRSAETETWTREEVLLFESLPKDLVQFVISKHLPRIVDVENACRAFGSEQCRKWRIFRFIFYARFGKEAWEKAHARHPFVNDAWFLRAYEMTQFLLDPKHKAPLQVYVRLEQNVRDVTYTDYSALPSDDEVNDLPQVTANVTYVTRVYTREREEGWNFQVVQSTRGNIVAGNELGETDAIVLYRKIFEQDPLGPQFPSDTFSNERLLDVSGHAPLSDTLVFSICYYFYELLRVGMSMEKATILNEETDEKTRVPNLEAPACAVCSKATAVFACGAKATCGHIYCSAECADTAWFKLGHYAHCGVGYDNLPNEILQNIMLETKVKRLSLLCLTSSRFAVICEDPRFMHQYVLRRREEEWERMVNSWVQIGHPPNYAALRKWLPYLLQHPTKWNPASVYPMDFINLLATDGAQDLLALILEDGRENPTVGAMLSACKMGHLGIVLLFLQDGRLDPGEEEDDDDEGFEEYPTAFQSAAAFGHADIVNALLQDGRADPSANNGAALFFASQKGHVNVMDALLADARVSPVQAGYSSSLDEAIFGGKTNVLSRLLQDQRVIDVIQNVQGIVVTAVEENQLEILKLLLDVPDINPAELDNAGMRIACEKDLVDIVSLLMRYYPATSPFVAKEEGEYSAFQMAVLKGSAKVVALLLKHPHVPIGSFNAIDLVFDNASRIVMFPLIEVLIEDGRTPLQQRHLTFAIEHHIVNVAIAFLADARLQSEAILEQALVEAQGENLSELVKVIQSIQRVQGGVQKQRKLVKTRI